MARYGTAAAVIRGSTQAAAQTTSEGDAGLEVDVPAGESQEGLVPVEVVFERGSDVRRAPGVELEGEVVQIVALTAAAAEAPHVLSAMHLAKEDGIIYLLIAAAPGFPGEPRGWSARPPQCGPQEP